MTEEELHEKELREKICEIERNSNFLLGISSGWEDAAKWLDERAVQAWRDRDHKRAEILRAESDTMMKKYKSAREQFEKSKKELVGLERMETADA